MNNWPLRMSASEVRKMLDMHKQTPQDLRACMLSAGILLAWYLVWCGGLLCLSIFLL